MGEGGGGEEKGRFLSFTSLPFSLPFFPFSPETPDTQARLSLTKMPTSGDLKSTPHPRMSTQLPSRFPNQLTQPEWEWLRTLYEVLHELHTIKIHNHCFNVEKSLLETRLNMCKNARENVL